MKALAFEQSVGTRSELVLVAFMVMILLVLFTPIPAFLLDFLLILNFSFALLILLLTFYMDKPIGFSTFPTLLLICTLFRLSLNIAATRLILSDAHAGAVIGAIGAFVVGGSYVIGLVVFLILIVVQYVVVTSGAQRVAEVAARFTLDGMPGKQMSIDADLNMGLIDEKEAQEKRKNIEREASFYGSMDGASKFVKGDAIAGIIIILINIIGGLSIGIAEKGMGWEEALHTYTLLTVGDGIVTQIPALIISTATGIIITRAATDAFFGDELARQIGQYPKSIMMVMIFLLGFLFLPGIPVIPVLFYLVLGSAIFYFIYKRKFSSTDDKLDEASSTPQTGDIYDEMKVEPVEIMIGKNLVDLVGKQESIFLGKIKAFRKQYALDMGLVFPEVRVHDASRLPDHGYEIRIFNSKMAEGEIYPALMMAISAEPKGELKGIKTKDPSYNLPAVWIEESEKDTAKAQGYMLVNPPTVFITHFTEVIKSNAHLLLTRDEVNKLLQKVKERHAGLYEELIPAVMSISDIQKVLQNLLREKVSIRNIELILEALVDHGKAIKSTDELTEMVRQKIASAICEQLINKQGELNVLTLEIGIEQKLQASIRSDEHKSVLIADPALTDRLVKQLAKHAEQMLRGSQKPILLCSPTLRRHLKKIVDRMIPQLHILSLNEIPSTISIKSADIIRVD